MIKKYKDNIIAIVFAIILTLFVWHKFLISGNTVILLLVLFATYYFMKNVIANQNKRKCVITLIISVIFGIIEVICSSINYDYTLNYVIDKWLLLNFAGYAILMWGITSSIYTVFEKNNLGLNKPKIKRPFFWYWALIFIAWIPYFLRYYPGLLTADSCTQVAQGLGLAGLSSHHPIVHTGIIAIFTNIGTHLFNNINLGVAFYTIFQMLTMSAMFAGIVTYISKKNVPAFVRILALLYYMFYPINALFSVTMWKDVLFAGIIPIYVIMSMELILNTEEFFSKKKNVILYICIALLTFFLRNNGIYVVILTMPFILIVLRKYWKKVLIMFLATVVLYEVINTALMSAFNIKKGSIAEMLSIPLQQVARVENYHRDELDEETIESINKAFKVENIGDLYNPILSDPVKAEFNDEYFAENKMDFIKLWLKLMKSYFKDYIESFISNSYGYYYPEATHWVANRTMEPNNMGLEQNPIVNLGIVSKVDSLIERREIPIISMFFSIGIAFWAIVICLGYKILNKEYKYILVYLPIFILWLTIVASPVFCEYRYAYPMFTVLPIFIALNFTKQKVDEK